MKTMKRLILPLSFFCFLFCIGFFLHYYAEVIQEKNTHEELIRMKTSADYGVTETVQTGEKGIMPVYRELYEENPDIIGWVKVEDTYLDYPVMQTKGDNEYYLHRNFEKEYQYSGLPFLDARCDLDIPSTNLIIYGHNMKSESMFSCLTKYKNEEYFRKHPVIRFDTMYEESEYQIIAVVLSKVFKKNDNDFKFYQFVHTDSKAEFDEYIDNMKNLSLYDTGYSAVFGDQLLTLVTCSYHTENGRIAILSKKITNRK
jgi:sortase B